MMVFAGDGLTDGDATRVTGGTKFGIVEGITAVGIKDGISDVVIGGVPDSIAGVFDSVTGVAAGCILIPACGDTGFVDVAGNNTGTVVVAGGNIRPAGVVAVAAVGTSVATANG